MRERLEVLELRYGDSGPDPALTQEQGFVRAAISAALSAVGMKGEKKECSMVFSLPLDYKIIHIFLNVKSRKHDTYGVLRLLNEQFGNIITSLEAQWQCDAQVLVLKAWIGFIAPLKVELVFKQDNGLKMTVASIVFGHILPIKFISDFANYTREPFDIAMMLSPKPEGEAERNRFNSFLTALTSSTIKKIREAMGSDKFQKLETTLAADEMTEERKEAEARDNLRVFVEQQLLV